MEERFQRTEMLIGEEGLKRLSESHVAVFGIGGVGGYVAEALARLPRFLLRFAILILRIMDYFGWLPEALTDASPFHGSMIITDLGSLRIGPIYHHIYNFGTLPVFIAFGAKRHAYELDRHGSMVDHKYVDCKIVMDERTVDGHYYAQFLQAYRYIFQHPEILEAPPTKVVEDVR